MKWITAANLDAWGRTNSSEPEMPALVADLISATAKDIRSIRFPNGDKGRTRGFDGILESDGDELFVPKGKSIWEIGTETEYKGKALNDFVKRSGEVGAAEQKDITLVLVTPFTWDSTIKKYKLENWQKDRKKEQSWKDVVVIDGSGLERWLMAAPAVAAWHARYTLKTAPVEAVRSIDEFWDDYANRFSPALVEAVLTTERERVANQLLDVLMGPPSQMSIIGDAADEVVAFAIAAIRSADKGVRDFIRNRTLVVDTAAGGRGLVTKANLAFLLRGDASRSPGAFAEVGPTIVPLGGWQRGVTGHELVRQTGFALTEALVKMGLPETKARVLAHGCGGSLAALERQIPGGAYERPPWLSDAPALLPAFLAGSWDSANELDKAIMTALAGTTDYASFEKTIRPFTAQAGAPIVREQMIYKVRAPLDAFIHSGHLIAPDVLNSLRPILAEVFGRIEPEPDPAEPAYMRRRSERHSDWLRDGLATTLLLIALWQKQAALAIEDGFGQAFANEVIAALPGLSSNSRLLTSLDDELPMLAEAAPSPFLSALELMLEGNGEAIRPIFDEVEGYAFPTSRHTGVLWALERLAWDPKLFRRTCLVLARLAEIDPGGRLANRPSASLADIFLLWLPSTFASLATRLSVLDEITRDHPAIGWKLLLQLMPEERSMTSGTAKPRLRGFDSASSRDVSYQELWDAQSQVCARAIALADGDPPKMSDLLRPMFRFRGETLDAAIAALQTTLETASRPQRESLWSDLHDSVKRHRRFATADWAIPGGKLDELEAIADTFAPQDAVLKILDLFDHFSYSEDERSAAGRRADAVLELATTRGTSAILELVAKARAFHLVLEALVGSRLGPAFLERLARESILTQPTNWHSGSYLEIYRQAAGDEAALAVVGELHRPGENDVEIGTLLCAFPSEPWVWKAASGLGAQVEEAYWRKLRARWTKAPRRILLRLMVKLARHGRPVAALETGHDRLREIPSCLLLSLLDSAVTEITNGDAQSLSQTLDYEMEQIFKELDERKLADLEIAKREYAFLPLLERNSRPLRIHRLMADDPDFFHEVLRNVYREETPTERGDDAPSDKDRSMWRQSYKLMSSFSLVPGFNGAEPHPGKLASWIDRMRELAITYDRRATTEMTIGNVLAHSPDDDADGGWPHRAVRDEIERLASSDAESGLRTERFNMRGVTVRKMMDGGEQERTLAEQYRKYAAKAEPWPRTSAVLELIAEGWERDADREDSEVRQRRMRD